MERDRITLALSSIKPSAWADFESFASEFLVDEFPTLRTMARESGDGGRDGELFDLTSDGDVKLQYSVTANWNGKIRKTVKRIIDGKKSALRTLIYATNQSIGADGDTVKADMFAEYKVIVDIRDQSYFADRRNSSHVILEACETLARKFVTPLLEERGIRDNVAPALTLAEERLAFLHLSVDLLERDGDKNLTKGAFESLVLAVLYGTTHDISITKTNIIERIERIVGKGAPGQVRQHIENALSRLSGKNGKIKHIGNKDLYHISYSESQQIAERSEHFLAQEQYFERDILAAIYGKSDQLDDDEEKTAETVLAIRTFIESTLLDYGEKFTESLRSGSMDALESTLEERISETSFATHLPSDKVLEALRAIFEEGSDETKAHLRRLLDSYTVFAILKATPDVQGVLRKISSGGKFWLDTSFLLPVIAEKFGGGSGAQGELLAACRHVDAQLFVTSGIIQEIDSHLNSCLNAVRTSRAGAATPYLLSEYIMVGHDKGNFAAWQEDIRGSSDPLLDIQEYLAEEFGVKVRDLTDEVEKAPQDIRDATVIYWQEKTERRRATMTDTVSRELLASHDVENTLGVIQLRGRGESSVFGYRHWLITFDGAARGLASYLETELGQKFITPVMSPAYLTQLLRFLPTPDKELRRKLDRIPVMLDLVKLNSVPEQLVEEVSRIREAIPGVSPRRMRRAIRDSLNEIKSTEPDQSTIAD